MRSDQERSATAVIVRELLRTPAFRELVKSNLQAATDEDARQLAHTLIWEDVDVSLGAASRLSLVVNSLIQVLGELNGLLEQASPRVRRAFFARLAEEMDGEALKEQAVRLLENLHVLLWEDEQIKAGVGGWLAGLANHGLAQLARMHEQDPRRLAEPLRAVLGEILPRLDFGLVRRGVTAMADSTAEVLPAALERVAGDSVLLANLLAALPSVVNAALATAGRAVAAADMPGEVLASTVFNLIQKVDTESLATLVDALGANLLALHSGSLVLGRHEPHLRAVLTGFGQDVLPRVDHGRLADVAVDLGEDAGTISRVAADLLLRDPELAGTVVSAYLGAAQAAAAGAADAMAGLGRLSDRDLDRVVDRLRDVDPTRASRLLNEAAALAWRVLERDPDLGSRAAQQALDALDTETLGRVASRLLVPALRARLAALSPRQAGRAVGAGLSRVADALERDPTLVRDAVDAALKDMDPERTRRLVDGTVGQVKEAVGQRPELVKALVQPLVAALGSLLWEYMRTLGQSEGEEAREEEPQRQGLRRRLWRRIRNKE